MSIVVASQRVLQGRVAKLAVTFEDQDGAAAVPTAPVTVHVTRRSDGSDVVPAGTGATVAAGVASVSLTPTQTALLDTLTCTWIDAGGITMTTVVDVAGGYYVSVADVQNLKNMGNVDPAVIVDARRWFEDKFEDYVGAAMVPRFRLVDVWGDGTDNMQLPTRLVRAVRAVRWGNVSLGAAALANLVVEASGKITRYWPLLLEPTDDELGIWSGRFPEGFRVTVGYEHGLDRPSAPVKEAALIAIRDKLLTDHAGSREYAHTTELGGFVRTSMPGARRPFGIPFVDEAANAARRDYGMPAAATVQVA